MTDPVSSAAGQNVITLDRRRKDRRNGDAAPAAAAPAAPARRKKQRRRHIDPTTCERDYTDDEIEFMRAMDDYKNRSGRMFPTCSEVLEVIRDLGYVRLTEEQRDALQVDADVTPKPDGSGSADDADSLEEEFDDEPSLS